MEAVNCPANTRLIFIIIFLFLDGVYGYLMQINGVNQCMEFCPSRKGVDPLTNICEDCDSTCSECINSNDAGSCTVCFNGYYLYGLPETGGKCV